MLPITLVLVCQINMHAIMLTNTIDYMSIYVYIHPPHNAASIMLILLGG